MTPPVTQSQVMDLFAASYRQGTEMLAEYIARYPEHAEELVDYAHELNLQRERAAERSITPDEESWIEAQVTGLSEARETPLDPFAALQPSRFVEMRKALDVPSAVLEAFRDRVVDVASVPVPFLEHLADQLKVGIAALVAFLDGSPRLALGVAFKADLAPVAPAHKVGFASVLDQAGVPAERIAVLVREDA